MDGIGKWAFPMRWLMGVGGANPWAGRANFPKVDLFRKSQFVSTGDDTQELQNPGG